MDTILPFEAEAIRLIADEHAELRAAILDQLAVVQVKSRFFSGAGVISRLYVPDSASRLSVDESFLNNDVAVSASEELPEGGICTLYIHNGRLAGFSTYSFSDTWPSETFNPAVVRIDKSLRWVVPRKSPK